MKCSLCGYQFSEKDAESACSKCTFSKGCGLVKCPNCGFELAPDPDWIKRIKNRRGKNAK